MIGSAARRSTRTKITVITAANTRIPTICSDTQSYCTPPSDSPISNGTTTSTSSAIPA